MDQINAWIGSGRMHSATGSDRYLTAAGLFMNSGTITHHTIALATGDNWADALAGGSVAGMHNGLMDVAARRPGQSSFAWRPRRIAEMRKKTAPGMA